MIDILEGFHRRAGGRDARIAGMNEALGPFRWCGNNVRGK